MPLAEHAGRVARLGQHFGHRDFPLDEAVDALTHGHGAIAAANRIAPGHQRRTRRGALDFDIEIGKPQTFGRDLVQSRRFRAANDAATIEAWLTPTEVVHEDEDDIGLVLRHR